MKAHTHPFLMTADLFISVHHGLKKKVCSFRYVYVHVCMYECYHLNIYSYKKPSLSLKKMLNCISYFSCNWYLLCSYTSTEELKDYLSVSQVRYFSSKVMSQSYSLCFHFGYLELYLV